MKKIIYLVVMMAVLVGCFFSTTKTVDAKEKCVTGQAITSSSHILHNDPPETVTKPIEKGKGLAIYLVRVIGWMMAIFGLVFLGISWFSHQTDQRITAIIAFGVGLLIAFSPEIVDWLTKA